MLDISLIFPHQNKTYTLMQRFPVIFTLQNAKLAKHLKPIVNLNVLNRSMTMVEIINERTVKINKATLKSMEAVK
ncbi:hypothetical protein CTA1_12966 [Colletotrichum tanaceti]|uniref:DUF7136 domain-containing protein n=1 Tax=Colletotrichum tanaceti TaxID=1306861 RepID=A0A4U6WYQ4_9PEZI|nr:hypothetical protein CTA1_12966 [Colletotrichum tanaceti]